MTTNISLRAYFDVLSNPSLSISGVGVQKQANGIQDRAGFLAKIVAVCEHEEILITILLNQILGGVQVILNSI